MLRRLVSWCYDHRRRVVALWIAGLVAATILAGTAGGDNEMDVTVPGSDSAEAVELLQDRFPTFAGGTVDVVYTSPERVTGPAVTATIDRLAGEIAEVDHVVAVEPGPAAPDGETGILQVRFDEPDQQIPAEAVERVMDLAGEAEGDGLQFSKSAAAVAVDWVGEGPVCVVDGEAWSWFGAPGLEMPARVRGSLRCRA